MLLIFSTIPLFDNNNIAMYELPNVITDFISLGKEKCKGIVSDKIYAVIRLCEYLKEHCLINTVCNMSLSSRDLSCH